jgi:hypothetical protein
MHRSDEDHDGHGRDPLGVPIVGASFRMQEHLVASRLGRAG